MEKLKNIPLVVLGAHNDDIKNKRVVALCEYIRVHPSVMQIVFSGGKTHWKNHLSEAEKMKQMFEEKIQNDDDLNIENFEIFTENNSSDTEENAENVIHLFGGKIEKILLLSDAIHIIRASHSFSRRGVEVEKIISEYWFCKNEKWNFAKLCKNAFTKQSFKNLWLEILAHILSCSEKWRKFIKDTREKRGKRDSE